MSSTANPEIRSKIKPNLALKEPPLFRIIYFNDDHTSMEFVIESLIKYFDYSVDTATEITVNVHEQGSAVVAVMPYELGEQLGTEITLEARAKGFPLVIKLEPEV